jgi:hypothetical protein
VSRKSGFLPLTYSKLTLSASETNVHKTGEKDMQRIVPMWKQEGR